MVDLDRA